MDSLRGPDESLYAALERANEMFLTPEELRRKQNQKAFAKLHIQKPGPTPGRRVVPFQ